MQKFSQIKMAAKAVNLNFTASGGHVITVGGSYLGFVR
jgi:hypothetical protein